MPQPGLAQLKPVEGRGTHEVPETQNPRGACLTDAGTSWYEVGVLVAFLMGPESGFITGADTLCNGGVSFGTVYPDFHQWVKAPRSPVSSQAASKSRL